MGDVVEIDLKAAISRLETDGNYRVLRKLIRKQPVELHRTSANRLALFLDVETTGISAGADEIIELAMLPFLYSLNGQIEAIGAPFVSFNEPTIPIPEDITKLTGITQEMVAGHRLNSQEISQFVAPAAIIIAHNARFDRPFVEKFDPIFSSKPWACSMTQVPWKSENYDGVKLRYLAMLSGFFYEPHRADADCFAALELLSMPLQHSKRHAMSILLEEARLPTYRVWAENAVFDKKDLLKARGYRWNVDLSDRPRAWYIDRPLGMLPEEYAFLREYVFEHRIPIAVEEITATSRFSIHEGSGIQYVEDVGS